MSHQDYSNIFRPHCATPKKLESNNQEPVYVPDWDDLAERSLIMSHYWQHVHELAKLQLVMERIGGER